MRKLKLVEIEWQDIEEHAGWQEVDQRPLVILKSYGLLVSKTRWHITIANCYDPETTNFSGVHKYPKGCILNMRVIEVIKF